MKNEAIPRLRFEGFRSRWNLKNIKNLAIVNPKASLPDKFRYVDLGSVAGTHLESSKLITRHIAPSRAQRVAKKNDIFYQSVRPYQKNNLYFNFDKKINYVFSSGYMQIRPNNKCLNYFLFTIFQTNKFVYNVLLNCTGTSYPAINSTNFKSLNINIPISNNEQLAIGKFFAELDKLIQLQQKKVSLLKKLKRGYLQKLFPRKGELAPRLRFKGFYDKWMRKSLKNIVTYINTGKSKRKGLCRVCNNTYKYPFISASTLKGYSKTYDYKGMILLCTRVGNVGYLHLVNGKFQISDNTIVIKGKNNLYFIKGLLRTQRFQRIAEGSSQKLIREKELEQFLLLVPRFKEQEKINELFKILNIQIKYQLCKLWNLRRLKKAYLQKMFC